MRIDRSDTFDIAAPSAAVWKIVGEEFAHVGTWSRTVKTSRALDGPALPGAPARGRVCQVAGFGEVHEVLRGFDPDERSLELTIEKGLPFFVKESTFRSRVISAGAGSSRFDVHQTMKITAIPGVFLYPMLRRKLNQTVDMIVEDLRRKAERGELHPDKLADLVT